LSVGIEFELEDAVDSEACFASPFTTGDFGNDSGIVGSRGNPWLSAPSSALNLFEVGGRVDRVAGVWFCFMVLQGLSENPEDGEGGVPLTVEVAQGFVVTVE
jgi:hypothetical protein